MVLLVKVVRVTTEVRLSAGVGVCDCGDTKVVRLMTVEAAQGWRRPGKEG